LKPLIFVMISLFLLLACSPNITMKDKSQFFSSANIIAEQSPLVIDFCDPGLLERLRPTFPGIQFSCYQSAQVDLAGGTKGWLATVSSSDLSSDLFKTVLIWVVDQRGNTRTQMPIDVVKKEDQRWDFLEIHDIFDFDADGSLEALVVGTGGAGMYFHYPMLLRLNDGKWEILFRPDKPFFYGVTELLPKDSQGRIQLAITSVDQHASWAFSDCSLCPHPFAREIYSLINGKLYLNSSSPVAYPLSVVSDLILAAQSNSFVAAYKYFSGDATVGGVQIKDEASLEAALKKIHLPETKWRCHGGYEEEKELPSTTTIQGKKVAILGGTPVWDVVRFECFAGDGGEFGYLYSARVRKEADRFVIFSVDLLDTVKY
jgi:hypothetical protein